MPFHTLQIDKIKMPENCKCWSNKGLHILKMEMKIGTAIS